LISAILRIGLAKPIGPNQTLFGDYPRFGSGHAKRYVSRRIQRRQTKRIARALCPVI
jgi:hypothetical protein